MSKILIKLVDDAIIPSLLLVIAKIGGLFLSNLIFGIEFDILAKGTGIFPYQLTYKTTEGLIQANSYSNLLMVIVAAIGCGVILYKISNFQDKRISPGRLLKLAEEGGLKLIETGPQLYVRVFVWMVFLWIAAILSIASTVRQDALIWTAVVSGVVAFLMSLLLAKNIEIDYTGNKQITSSI